MKVIKKLLRKIGEFLDGLIEGLFGDHAQPVPVPVFVRNRR